MKESKKTWSFDILFFQFHPQRMEIFNDNWTYFLFHYTFFLPKFKLYSCICPPHERVKSWCGLILELGFSSRDFGSKYHNLYSTTSCLMRPFFRTPFNGRYRQVWLQLMPSYEVNILLIYLNMDIPFYLLVGEDKFYKNPTYR